MLRQSLARRALRIAATSSTRRLTNLTNRKAREPKPTHPSFRLLPQPLTTRPATTDTPPVTPQNTPAGDAAVEEITELYATAQDEFEIASESTDANATYAEEDRKAAREELERVLEAYRTVGEGGDRETAEEVRRRIGQRIRELEQGVKAMEERAMEHD